MSNAASIFPPSAAEPPRPRATPALTPAARAKLRALVSTRGVAGAARILGLSRHAVVALHGECPVHAGTVALAEQRLATVPTTSP